MKVSESIQEKFYTQDFPNAPEDFGHTNLVAMDIETGDSHLSHKSLKFIFETYHLGTKGVRDTIKGRNYCPKCLSWASPIVVVPKQTQPREHPRRRLCIDYQALNNLLPCITKGHSKPKGVLTFEILPKFGEMYDKLASFNIYSTLYLRSIITT